MAKCHILMSFNSRPSVTLLCPSTQNQASYCDVLPSIPILVTDVTNINCLQHQSSISVNYDCTTRIATLESRFVSPRNSQKTFPEYLIYTVQIQFNTVHDPSNFSFVLQSDDLEKKACNMPHFCIFVSFF